MKRQHCVNILKFKGNVNVRWLKSLAVFWWTSGPAVPMIMKRIAPLGRKKHLLQEGAESAWIPYAHFLYPSVHMASCHHLEPQRESWCVRYPAMKHGLTHCTSIQTSETILMNLNCLLHPSTIIEPKAMNPTPTSTAHELTDQIITAPASIRHNRSSLRLVEFCGEHRYKEQKLLQLKFRMMF